MTSPESPTCLYRFYDDGGALLYVGITSSPNARMAAHAREKAWWPEVDADRTTIQWLTNRPEAERAEVEAIRDESPRYNVADNPAERSAMVARAREVALSGMAARSTKIEEWEALADAIESVADPAERARLAGRQLAEVPTMQSKLRSVRVVATRELKAGGMSNAEIARVLGVHRNRVQQLLA
ncbi:hypothetical protein ABZU92_18250 [Micromonospora arida]|uniref:hypothetical protein n=1 Tax=Micromonospora arida TaxID=2203715 RepID=UPI0033BF9ECE